MSKVSGYHVPLLSYECYICNSYVDFVYCIWKYFIFVSTVFIIFQGYAPLNNCFDVSFNISN